MLMYRVASLMYRASHVVKDLGMGWLGFWVFRCLSLPNSAWADGNLAEAAICNMVEHSNQSQPTQGLQPHRTPCKYSGNQNFKLRFGRVKRVPTESTSYTPKQEGICIDLSLCVFAPLSLHSRRGHHHQGTPPPLPLTKPAMTETRQERRLHHLQW